MDEQDIRCFQHCREDKNIFCFEVPQHCPICSEELSDFSFLLPPFCLPSPFCYHERNTGRRQIPSFSVVVKPTHGHFIRDYKDGDNLHVGLTDMYGNVFNFDGAGVQRQSDSWNCSIAVPIIDDSWSNTRTNALKKAWGKELAKSINDEQWNKDRYHETTNNCYHYVIAMVSAIMGQPLCKKKFSEMFVLPETTKVAKFITIHKRIEKFQIVIEETEC